MKKRNAFIVFLIIFQAFSFSAWSDVDGQSCDDPAFDFSLLTKVAASECIEKSLTITKCKCIYKEIDSKPERAFQAENGYKDYLKAFEEKKIPYKERFNKVYEKVTIQAAAQEEVLGLNDNSRPVGCTPVDLAEGIRKKKIISIPVQVHKLIELRNEARKLEQKCNEGKAINITLNAHGCPYYKARVELLTKRIESMQSGPENCNLVREVLKDKETEDKLDEVMKYFSTNQPVGVGKVGLEIMTSLLDKVKKNEKVEDKECFSLMQGYAKMMEIHQDKVAVLADGSVHIPPTDEPRTCRPGDTECDKFTKQNVDLLDKTAKIYEVQQNECVTYAQYSTYKGMPSPHLLRLFAHSAHPEKFLEHTTNNKHARNFIKANPLMAVVARSGEDSAKALGLKLKEMAKNILKSKEKGVGANLNGYLNFMTGEDGFKGIYQHDKKESNMAVCDELQRYHVAVDLSDDIPEIKEAVSSDPLDQTNKLVKECIGELYTDTGTTNLDTELELSPIADLGSEEDEEPSKDGYEKFKAEYCKGYEEYATVNCKDGNAKACRENFKSGSDEVNVLKDSSAVFNITEELTEENLNNMRAKTDEKSQDHDFKTYAKAVIFDRKDQQSIALIGEEDDYINRMQGNQAISNSIDAQTSFEQYQKSLGIPSINGIGGTSPVIENTTAPVENVASKGFDRSAEDTNQVRPDFNTTASTTPPITNFSNIPQETIKNATTMTDIDPEFDKRSPEEKLSSFKALKDFVDEGGAAPIFKPTEEIAKIESEEITGEKIVKTDKQEGSQEKSPVSGGSGQVNRSFASTGQNVIPPVANAPVLSQFPRQQSRIEPGEKISKAQKSYEEAVAKMGSGQILIQEGLAEGPFEIPRSNIITADGPDGIYPFNELTKPDVLSEFLANRLGNSVDNGESVMIKKPGTQEYFVVKATKKDGITAYQLIPFVKKEDIKLYSNLKNLFRNNN